MTNPKITCREWSAVKAKLHNREITELLTIAERAAKRLKLSEDAVLKRTSSGLKTGQIVGVITTPSVQLEILPKIDAVRNRTRDALTHMISVAYDLKLADGELASLNTQNRNLLEIFIQQFANRLFFEVQRGLARRYVNHKEDLMLLRGKLNVTRQFTRLAARPDLVACSYDLLSVNTPLNQIFKAAISLLTRITKAPSNFKLLCTLKTLFDQVSDTRNPLALEGRVYIDRTNSNFQELFKLACFFLRNNWHSTTSGQSQGYSLLFPMNELFENTLKRTLRPEGMNVKLQHSSLYAIADHGSPLFNLQPDAVIYTQDDETIVLDTKWKELDPKDNKKGVKQSDIYQILTYANAYKAKRIILLYPWHLKLKTKKPIVRHWKVIGADIPLDIATVNVANIDSVPETLKEIVYEQNQQ